MQPIFEGFFPIKSYSMAIRKGTGSARAGTHAVLASPTRVQLLDALRANPTPMTVRELAHLQNLHVTTVRFHLDALSDAGLVSKEVETSPSRGRPSQLYRALPPLGSVTGGASGYERLAQILAKHFAHPQDCDPAKIAEAAGRAWAHDDLADMSGSVQSVDDAAIVINTLFAEMGFDPELESDTGKARIRLHACPFESVARQSPHVVCTLHLGLIRGALARLDAHNIDSRLIPWDTSHTCLVHLESA